MDPFSNGKHIPKDWVPQATKLLTKLGESKKDNCQTIQTNLGKENFIVLQ